MRELPWFPFYVPNYVFLTQDTRSSTYNKKKKKKKRRRKKKVLFYRWPVSHNVVFKRALHIKNKIAKIQY